MQLGLAYLAIAMIFVRKHHVGTVTVPWEFAEWCTEQKEKKEGDFFHFFYEGEYYSMLQRGISTAHHLVVLENTGATCKGFTVATENLNHQKKCWTFLMKSVFKDYVHPLLPEAANLPVVTLTAYQDMKTPYVQNIIHFQITKVS